MKSKNVSFVVLGALMLLLIACPVKTQAEELSIKEILNTSDVNLTNYVFSSAYFFLSGGKLSVTVRNFIILGPVLEAVVTSGGDKYELGLTKFGTSPVATMTIISTKNEVGTTFLIVDIGARGIPTLVKKMTQSYEKNGLPKKQETVEIYNIQSSSFKSLSTQEQLEMVEKYHKLYRSYLEKLAIIFFQTPMPTPPPSDTIRL